MLFGRDEKGRRSVEFLAFIAVAGVWSLTLTTGLLFAPIGHRLEKVEQLSYSGATAGAVIGLAIYLLLTYLRRRDDQQTKR
jgi:cytosine/uracil/thiamine/allantoin permease